MATGVDALETETSDAVQETLALVKAVRTHQLDELDGVHEMPLFPVFSSKPSSMFTSKLKNRMHFVCPVCLCKADGPGAGPKGKGYGVQIDKEWFTKALPYLRVAALVLKVGLSVAGLPSGVAELMGEVCAGSDAILQEAVSLVGEELDSRLESVLDANQDTIAAEDSAEGTSAPLSALTPSASHYPIVLPRLSIADREVLQRLMIALDGGTPPRFSGLERVTCREGDGATAWVCSRVQHQQQGGAGGEGRVSRSCKDLFLQQGVACLKLVYADRPAV
jgi:hypothetical protein